MAQFDVYANPSKDSRSTYPYLVAVQSDLLDDLRTTVVIPVSPLRLVGGASISRLCPVLELEGEPFVLLTQQISGVMSNTLSETVNNVSHYRDAIVAAMDFLISGV